MCVQQSHALFVSFLLTAPLCPLSLFSNVLSVSPMYTHSHSAKGICYTTPLFFHAGCGFFVCTRTLRSVPLDLKVVLIPSYLQPVQSSHWCLWHRGDVGNGDWVGLGFLSGVVVVLAGSWGWGRSQESDIHIGYQKVIFTSSTPLHHHYYHLITPFCWHTYAPRHTEAPAKEDQSEDKHWSCACTYVYTYIINAWPFHSTVCIIIMVHYIIQLVVSTTFNNLTDQWYCRLIVICMCCRWLR